jgi:gas vesicle protein
MDITRNNSNVWPYVIVGSAIGGAVGYLFMTESGRRIRHSITHPDELASDLEEARGFIERKARVVNDQVHGVLNRAKHGIEEGERAYHEAARDFQNRVNNLQGKSGEITSNVHKAVDNMNRTAVTIEQSVLDPVVELGALYRGIERGIRAVFGRGQRRLEGGDRPAPVYRDTRIMG